MTRKIIITVMAVAILGAGFIVMSKLADSKKPPQKKKVKNVTTVFTDTVRNASVPIMLSATGRLDSKNQVELFAEVQGVMLNSGKPFKTGTTYRQGEKLITIDSEVFRANLQAQKSELQNLITAALADIKLDFPNEYDKWSTFLNAIDLNSPLPAFPEMTADKERMFLVGRKIQSTYYNVRNGELTLDKYTIYAPFDGILINANLNPGTLIRPGQQLGSFIDASVFEMECPIPVSMVRSLKIGQGVDLHTASDPENNWTGKISRISSAVNPGTQTINVYIETKGSGLEQGMFLEATIDATEIENAFEIDRSTLFNSDQVYVAKDTVLIQKEVVVKYLNERTAVAQGLSDGDLVLSKMPPSAYPGMRISIYNEKN